VLFRSPPFFAARCGRGLKDLPHGKPVHVAVAIGCCVSTSTDSRNAEDMAKKDGAI